MNPNLKEIAKLPSERKIWLLRKFYGGNGGALPPTDPRILAMTREQIELEFQHMLLDQNQKDGNQEYFVDEGFEDYDKETEDTDNRLSEMPKFGSEASDPNKGVKDLPKPETEINNEDEWEDVEIDD